MHCAWQLSLSPSRSQTTNNRARMRVGTSLRKIASNDLRRERKDRYSRRDGDRLGSAGADGTRRSRLCGPNSGAETELLHGEGALPAVRVSARSVAPSGTGGRPLQSGWCGLQRVLILVRLLGCGGCIERRARITVGQVQRSRLGEELLLLTKLLRLLLLLRGDDLLSLLQQCGTALTTATASVRVRSV